MKSTAHTSVVDACGLICFLNGEKGADKFLSILEQSADGQRRLLMHAVTLGEVYYDCLRVSGEEKAEQLLVDMEDLPIEVIWGIDANLLRNAGYFKAHYSISYADSFVLGCAREQSASVISTDHHEFGPVQRKRELVFEWLR